MENTTNTKLWYILPIADNYSLRASDGRFCFLFNMRRKAKKPVLGIIIESKNGPLAFSRGPSSSVYSTYFYVAEPLRQCCPTLSPIATCGDKHFECSDRHEFLDYD